MSPRGIVHNERMRADAIRKINSAALEVFAEFGYAGATIRHIAQSAGLSYGLVYHYFPSKEEIFRNLVDLALDSSMDVIRTGLNAPGKAWDQIRYLSAHLVEKAFTGESSYLFIIMIQALTQGKRIQGLVEYIAERSVEHNALLIPVIIQSQAEGKAVQGDPAMLSAAFFSFIQGLALLAFGGQGLEKKITPEHVVIASMRSSRISVKTSSGGIRGKDIASATSIVLKTSSGAIVLSGANAILKASSTSGNQQYEDVRGSIAAKSSSGAIQGNGIECTGSSVFQSSSGGIQIAFTNPLSDFSFDLKLSSGKLVVGEAHGSKKLVSGSGAIRISGSSTSGK